MSNINYIANKETMDDLWYEVHRLNKKKERLEVQHPERGQEIED